MLGKTGSIVAVGITLYVTLLCWTCHVKFQHYEYGDFDLALHAQSMWSILHGSLDCSILGIPFLGNHMVFILFLIAPLYAVFPSPLLLLYLQTLALGLGAWWIWLIARREVPEKWAAGLALAYLIYPPLIYLNLYEFHPIALAVPLLLGMLYYYKTERVGPFLTCLLLGLSCQENMALVAIALAGYAWFDRRRKLWLWAPLVAGIMYFWLAVFVIMPRLNNNTIQFIRLYSHLGESLPDILRNIIIHPLYTLTFMCRTEKLVFLSALLGPVAYLSLLSPLSLLPASLILAQRLLSIRLSETTIVYHYQAEFIPFIFFAAIYGIKRLLTCKHRAIRPALSIALVLFPLTAFLTSGILPTLRQILYAPENHSFIRSRKTFVIENLPHHASVLATFECLPRLANRKSIYSLHHVYTGRYTLSGVPYPLPNVDTIIMDTNDPLTFSVEGFYDSEHYKRLQAVLAKPGWKLVEHVDGLLVFRNLSGASAFSENVEPMNLVEYIERPAKMSLNIDQTSVADIQLLGFKIDISNHSDTVPLTLYWRKLHENSRDYDMAVTIRNSKKRLTHKILSPGSRIWPPQSWQTDDLIADRHRVHLDIGQSPDNDIHVSVELFPLERPTVVDVLVPQIQEPE